MARDLGEQNREHYARYKDDVKKEGKPFFPRAMFHDTVMSLVVVSVITALAAIWYYDADGEKPGILGPWYTAPAEPGTTAFVPRPDWGILHFLSISCGSSSGRDGLHRRPSASRRSPDPPHRPSVLRPPPRASAAASPGCDGRRGSHDPLDGSLRPGRAQPRRRRSAPSSCCSSPHGPTSRAFANNKEPWRAPRSSRSPAA